MANKEWLKKGSDGISFGERLGDLIANNRITATALARDTGLSQSAISDYLNKDRAPDCATIYSLARYFSVSADYLLGLTNIKTPFVNTMAVIRQTGLTEENALILEALQSKGANAYLDLLNDLISIAKDSDMAIQYLFMKATLNVPARASAIDLMDVLDEWADADKTKSKGLVQLTGEEAFNYYCSRIARELDNGLQKKYKARAEWRNENGID